MRVLIVLVLFFALSPLGAWYYFTAGNGSRMQWVFGSSCNSGSRPITMIYDSDIQSLGVGYTTAVATVMTQWNAPGGSLVCPAATCDPTNATYQRTMTAAAVAAFLANPTPNQIWVVWDSDGSVLSANGVDPNGTILGVGQPINLSPSRPQDICSGILFLNGKLISASASPTLVFQRVLLHELGHVLGFAHSIAGNNNGTVTAATGPNLPAMFPFLYTNSPTTLSPDDTAGVRAVYGP
ncbi:MAG TPA: hypothetical protein PKE49_16750 [Leptospiraceae bacterium]|nr:hypothetical protein [Leptospiraceae bacterium]HMX58176.1 hypothetical protein [Leptospiraceae bacterium]